MSPKPAPESPADSAGETLPTGVRADRVRNYGDCHNGRKLPGGELLTLLRRGDTVPNDSGKLCLSIIGAEAKTADVLRQLRANADSAAFLSRCKVRTFTPSDPLCRQVGLDAGRDFSIVVQGPEDERGRAPVLHRQNDFDDGPAGFIGAVRKIDPAYDPAQDKDRRKDPQPQPQPQPAPDVTPWYLSPWLLGVLLGVLALLVPSPLKPFVAALQAMNAARQPAAAPGLDLGQLAAQVQRLEDALKRIVPMG